MSGHSRGQPRLPPDDLSTRSLGLITPSRRWVRCACVDRPSLFDWDGRDTARFGGENCRYRCLYLASNPVTSFWEAFGEDLLDLHPDDRRISHDELASRQIVGFTLREDLRVFDATNPSALRKISADGSTFGAAYTFTQRWAAALMSHPDAPDGIVYPSRLNSPDRCLALFEKKAKKNNIHAVVLHNLSDDESVIASLVGNGVSMG